MSWARDRKISLAKKARKSDTDYIHAQLILAGQTVERDEIVGTSHQYYFDCGCVRSFSLVGSAASESVSACKMHRYLAKKPSR